MTEVKPWEPVSAYMTNPWGWQSASAKFKLFEWAETAQNGWVLTCTLANSQRVIVRALSEERKAARRMRRDLPSGDTGQVTRRSPQ